MILEKDNPFGDLAALAATVYGNVQNAKRERYANEQKAKNDADQHALIQAQLDDYQTKTQGDRDAQTRIDAFRAGLSFPPDWSKKTPQQQQDFLNQMSFSAMKAGDEKGAAIAKGMADNIALSQERYGAADLSSARVKWTNAQTNNALRLFDHQIQMQGMRISAEQARAGRRAIQARGSDPSGKAYQQALSAINDGTVRAAVQSSIDQYQDAQKAYSAAGDDSQPAPQYQAPNFTINTTVLPNGQSVPIVTTKAPGGGGAKPQAAPPQQQGGGNPISGAVQGVEHFFGNLFHGGGQQPQQPAPAAHPPKMAVGGKTYYLHSDGKYYTSPP